MPKISVCIPAYNRANVLPQLLDSIFNQNYSDYEVVICEDLSPQREHISKIVENFMIQYPGRIKYFENQENIGYDANYRKLFDLAQGEYCFFMGNDDLLCKEALETVAHTLEKYKNIGVIIRSYADFHDDPNNINQIYRYFETEICMPPGAEAICTAFRRSVIGSGMVYHRQSAIDCHTDKFDGSLLYQLHVVAQTLCKLKVVFVPKVTVLYRLGGVPDFGNAKAERGKFTPAEQTIDSSINFMKGMLDIAKNTENTTGLKVYDAIVSDITNYSFPILAIQGNREFLEFLRYVHRLINIGLGKKPIFYIYTGLILILGPQRLNSLIRLIKQKIGHTPRLGRIKNL